MKFPVLLFILLYSSVSDAQIQDADGFVLVKEEDSIKIFERWINFPNKKPAVEAREVKGEFIMKCSPHKVIHILKDESKIKAWQKHVTQFKVYTQHDSTYWHEYSYHDIPWPVSDQDHLLEYKSLKSHDGDISIAFKSVENNQIAPVKRNVTRMELKGSWLIEPGNDHVKVTYRIMSMPIGVPRIFTDPIIRSNLMSTIKALIVLAEQP